MFARIPRYVFPGHFEEVLSGEFRAALLSAEQLQSLHGLANLAIQHWRYDTTSILEEIDEARIIFSYTLDRSRAIEIQVAGDLLDGVAVIDSLYCAKSGESVEQADELTILTTDGSTVSINLKLYDLTSENGLAVAKAASTQAAQTFFT